MAVCLLLACNASATANAASIFDGSISSTYVEYASRIPIGIGDEYVFFRDSQYGYTLVSGDLVFNNGVFSLEGEGKQYNLMLLLLALMVLLHITLLIQLI